jgi:competence protein ComEA
MMKSLFNYKELIMKSLVAFLSAVIVSLSAVSFVHAESASPATKAQAQVEAPKSTQVNINTADADTLMSLKGVGAKKAEAILAWRKENGKFTSIEQLMDVKGIGESIFETNKSRLSL